VYAVQLSETRRRGDDNDGVDDQVDDRVSDGLGELGDGVDEGVGDPGGVSAGAWGVSGGA